MLKRMLTAAGVLLSPLVAAQTASAAVGGLQAQLTSNGCGTLCSEVVWLKSGAHILVRDESGEVIKAIPTDIPAGVEPLGAQPSLNALNGGRYATQSEGPGAPSGGTGGVTITYNYTGSGKLYTYSVTFIYVNYQLKQVLATPVSVSEIGEGNHRREQPK